MAAKKGTKKPVKQKTVKKGKKPKKPSFKEAQKRATGLIADWYMRNEGNIAKYLERLEKLLEETAKEPAAVVPFDAPSGASNMLPFVEQVGGVAVPVAPTATEEPKPAAPITFP